jgi:CDP-diacylglycerol--glycerol-3-phosphate 3-phosphatidyltransferase
MATVPNALTAARLGAAPLVVLLAQAEAFGLTRYVAVAVFAIAAMTDFLDGYIARKTGQVSNWGRRMDPVADKVLVAAALLIAAVDGTLRGFALWAALIVIWRDLWISSRRTCSHAAAFQTVSFISRIKTMVLYLACGGLLLVPAVPDLACAATLILWCGALLSLYSLFDYERRAFRS